MAADLEHRFSLSYCFRYRNYNTQSRESHC
jgi:hypothetical protein